MTSVQRRALLGISCAYSSTSTVALQVITGMMPLDLEIRYSAAKTSLKNHDPVDRDICLERILNGLYLEWQTRWDNSSKGRWSYQFFLDVRVRVNTPIWLNHGLSQLLTGHGNFAGKLFSMGLKPSPDCTCGHGEETAQHVIFDCVRWANQRARLELAVYRSGNLWPCEVRLLVSSRALFAAFDDFASHFVEMNT